MTTILLAEHKKVLRRTRVICALIIIDLIIMAVSYWNYRKLISGIDADIQGKNSISWVGKKTLSLISVATATEIVKEKKFRVEIGMKDSLAYKNNNPGNLMFAYQRGASEGFKGFAMFDSPEEGFSAVIDQIKLDQSRGLTLRKFISKYAPPHENDTWLYVTRVAGNLKCKPDTKIETIDTRSLAEEMIFFESKSKIIYE